MTIYGIILSVLPEQYQITSNKRLDDNTEILTSTLHNMYYEDAVNEIYNFCIQNNVAALLSNETETLSFGEIETDTLTAATSSIVTTVTFSDRKTEYALIVSSISQTADDISGLMLRLLPAVLAIIILLSSLSALICSKVIVAPIVKHLPQALTAAEAIEHLVEEIITISKMERMDLQDTIQDVSLLTSINDTIQAIFPLAQDKDIQIHQNILADTVLSVNPTLWKKALSNVIGNAVRHSPRGEHVFISLQTIEHKMTLVIENTGSFIPAEDLPHMFTPFYRADKSRNKATGGSGLGLYIVKTILDLHHMAYCIKNTQKGTAFFLQVNSKAVST